MPEALLALIETPGWYGKLPHLGDFAQRRLPEAFVRPWDEWLQQGMASLRSQLGEAWLPRFLVAPIRRFWLAPGLLTPSAWGGLVMPSVDRVGRHFPLTVALPLGSEAGHFAAWLAAEDWLAALDAATRQVLDVDCTPDDFDAALGALVPAVLDAEAAPGSVALAQALAARPGHAASSLWWCAGACEAGQFQQHAGLPAAADFASLLLAEPEEAAS